MLSGFSLDIVYHSVHRHGAYLWTIAQQTLRQLLQTVGSLHLLPGACLDPGFEWRSSRLGLVGAQACPGDSGDAGDADGSCLPPQA